MEEVGCCLETGKVHVKVDPKYFRPTEVVSQISPLDLCVLYCLKHVLPKMWFHSPLSMTILIIDIFLMEQYSSGML